MKCRSCGPGLSTLWASEAKEEEIHAYKPVSIELMDLSECEKVYFAGGEPLINPQHYEVLDKLIAQGSHPEIMYSTNLSVLGYKDKHVKDYWPKFNQILVHSSIDAVGPYAEVVRSGTKWEEIEQNIAWLRTQENVNIRVATVISAINIWFIDSLFEYLNWVNEPIYFEPVLANVDGAIGLTCIPYVFRDEMIETLSKSRFSKHVNIQKAIDVLKQQNYNQVNWYHFLAQQLILDNYRKENWFNLLPKKHQIYKEVMRVG
jgi:sulfatase maturation enzyme AslB (radical SAM superfamily)